VVSGRIAFVRFFPLPSLLMAFWSLPFSREPELMDDPALPAADHVAALGALATINVISRTATHLVRGVRSLQSTGNGVLTVVDVACGGGDVTVAIERRLAKRAARLRPVVVGVDISPRAVGRAEQLAEERASGATFQVCDVLRDGCPPCDVAVSSLFFHHLDDATAVTLLRHMAAAARVGIVISDLIRSRLGLVLAVVGTTVLSSSRVARVDGPLSVRAARTIPEYRRLLTAAGLSTATIRRAWPERAVIIWQRPDAVAGAGT
jgi:2-polyprenyl-3-methyl-5-hydroxy-6-metoxy-1,4-benzoquinol methylase